MRCHDDHQLGLLALIVGTAEQRTQDRDVTQPGNLTGEVGEVVLQEAGNRETFAVAHLDGGFRLAPLEGIDGEPVLGDRVCRVERRHRRLQLQVDDVAIDHGRREGKLHTEGLVFDRDRVAGAAIDRDRIFATGEELRLLPRKGGQVRFRQRAHEALVFQRFEKNPELERAGREAEADCTVGRGGDRGSGQHVVDAADIASHAGLEVRPACPAEAEGAVKLLGHAALHLGEADLQHHLLHTADIHQVRHPARRIAFGEVKRPVKLCGRGDDARQHDAVIGRAHLDLLARNDLLQPFLELRHVERDLNVHIGDKLALGRQKRQRGAPGGLAQNVDRLVRQRGDIRDAGVGDRKLCEGLVGFDDHRPVHRDVERTRRRAVDDLKCFRMCHRHGGQGQRNAQHPCRNSGSHTHVTCLSDHASGWVFDARLPDTMRQEGFFCKNQCVVTRLLCGMRATGPQV